MSLNKVEGIQAIAQLLDIVLYLMEASGDLNPSHRDSLLALWEYYSSWAGTAEAMEGGAP